MAKYEHEGAAIDFKLDSDARTALDTDTLEAGDIVIRDNLIGVVKNKIGEDELGALHLAGVYELSDAEIVATASDVDQGDAVELNVSADNIHVWGDAPDDVYFGTAIADGTSDDVVYARLEQRSASLLEELAT